MNFFEEEMYLVFFYNVSARPQFTLNLKQSQLPWKDEKGKLAFTYPKQSWTLQNVYIT